MYVRAPIVATRSTVPTMTSVSPEMPDALPQLRHTHARTRVGVQYSTIGESRGSSKEMTPVDRDSCWFVFKRDRVQTKAIGKTIEKRKMRIWPCRWRFISKHSVPAGPECGKPRRARWPMNDELIAS